MDYKIDIKTADQPNAGTNAGVDCQLLGERGETDKVILGDKDGGQYFQSGQTDSFDTRGKNVGKVRACFTSVSVSDCLTWLYIE